MREQQAKDFWSAYLKLILRKGQETTIVNPFEEFRDSVAKGGYESVSDEEYANIYDQVEELSVFWQQRPKDSVAHIVIEALSRTHLYEEEIQDIAGILAEASERTNYTQQMLQEMGAEQTTAGGQHEQRISKAKTEYYAVQSGFQHNHQVFTCHTRHFFSFFVVVTERFFQNTIDEFCFLFFAKLQTVLTHFTVCSLQLSIGFFIIS